MTEPGPTSPPPAHGHAHGRGSLWTGRDAAITWASGALVALGLALEFAAPAANAALGTLAGEPVHVADALFLAAVAMAGTGIFPEGLRSLRALDLDMALLMTVAIGGAVAVSLAFPRSFYFEAGTLAFLFSLAELLESHATERARRSLEGLMEMAPEEATVRRDGEERTVPVEEVEPGDVVVVRPGEQIPMDGRVVEGESPVNQAPVTGESVPVDKTPGDEVYAGTLDEGGYLEVEAAGYAAENTVARIVELVEEAEADRTEREQFVDRFASYYTPIVVALGVLLAVGPPLLLGAPWPTYIMYGLTLLVLACPCAFVIATPVAVVSGLTSAARNGVLVKGGTHLEALGSVDVLALDKTGTLTEGELHVTDVLPLNGNDEEDVLRCARGLQEPSEHPIAEAIVDEAAALSVEAREATSFEALTGRGVRAELEGTPHVAGNPDLLQELGFDLSHVHTVSDEGGVTAKSRDLCEQNDCLDLLEGTIPELQAQGKTVILVANEDRLEGVVAVADEVRPEAREALERVRAAGVERIVMLTGDNRRTAEAVGQEVGVDEVRSELLPEDKVAAVEALRQEGGGVAMVGDGVNDAPALAAATVGIAMGAAGTDAALESADVALMGDDLSKLPYLFELADRGNGVIKQNVSSSLAAKAILAAGVPFGLVPIWAAVLVGDAGMTLGVTGNAMRLARVRAPELGEVGVGGGSGGEGS